MLQTSHLVALLLSLAWLGPVLDARGSASHPKLPTAPLALPLAQDHETVAVAWVKAFNTGIEAMGKYRDAHSASPDEAGWREDYKSIKEELGELTVVRGMAPDDETMILGVESEGMGYLRLSFGFDQSGKVVNIQLGEERTNKAAPFEVESDDPRPVQAIDAYLRDRFTQDDFAGAVLIATAGEVWFEQAYGLASREFKVPNTIETRFDVGSFNKDYTRLAIMQLVQDGAFTLGDLVGEFLPDYPNEQVREEVTIRQLLEHRSGLGDYFDEDYFSTPMQQLREIEDYIPIWGPKPLEYEPGAREQYSNYGYTVLGAIVEAITGMSYPEYVVERIFEPAGMVDTGFFETDSVEPNVAVGYTYFDHTGRPSKTLRKNTFHEPIKGGPWGKSYSTARDLFRFFDALYGDRLVDPEFGWSGAGWDGQAMLAGGGPGLSAMLVLEGGLAVIVLSNQDEPGAEDIAERLHEGLR